MSLNSLLPIQQFLTNIHSNVFQYPPTHPVSLLIYALIALCSFIISRYLFFSSPSTSPLFPNAIRPPQVSGGLPIVGHSVSFSSSPYKYLLLQSAKYGKVFTLLFPGKKMHFVLDPRDYGNLFKNKSLSFAEIGNEIAVNVLDQSKLSAPLYSHEIHQQYNKYLARGEGLNELVDSSCKAIWKWVGDKEREMDEKKGGASSTLTPLYQFVQSVIFDAGVKSIFGERLKESGDLSTQLNQIDPVSPSISVPQLQSLFTIFDKSFPLLVGGVPSLFVRPALAARAKLIQLFSTFNHFPNESKLIAERTSFFTSHQDAYNVHDVGALHVAIVWASVANTMPASYWTLLFIIRDKALQKDIVKEIITHLPPVGTSSTSADEYPQWNKISLDKLTLLESTINECLRLCTGSMVLRKALQDTTVECHNSQNEKVSYWIKKDENVCLFPQLGHLQKDIWGEDAEEFDAYRFIKLAEKNKNKSVTKENEDGKGQDDASLLSSSAFLTASSTSHGLTYTGESVPSVFLPFGSGSSMCPGRFFAKNEIKVFVAIMLLKYQFELVDKEGEGPLQFDYSRAGLGVFPPMKDTKVKMTMRSSLAKKI